MDNLDDRLRADFRNSCLGFLADVSEIQFFAQLIQALVCRGIRCDKSHELWFNVQGHLTRFGLQEYAIITGLHAGYKLGLTLIVEGVITAPDNNGTWARKMSGVKMKNEKDVSYTIHEFSIAMQIWAYRPYLNSTNASVSGWVNDCPDFYAGPLPNNRSSVRMMRSLGTYRSVVGPQFHEVAPASGGHEGSAAGDGHDDESGTGIEDDETSMSDDRQTPEVNEDDGSKADESGDSDRDTSSETSVGDIEDDEDASG
ncbi:Hypothetical predicted protein [Olea europaea subsp. europaea]|uniref:DUF1985 domain-containing protein n=1 Tax=Olea europaea subsp. europaea TaxID=158383 RepID=A0A8S0QXM2_OLEEU|nr:Hypothetical predicted protein [Olea europaea subsp. europaea]